jgi:hypothetical protein
MEAFILGRTFVLLFSFLLSFFVLSMTKNTIKKEKTFTSSLFNYIELYILICIEELNS